MSVDMLASVMGDMFMTSLIVLLPILGTALIVGLIISVFQAATQIQEMTLTFVPKIIATVLVIILLLPFIAEKLMTMTINYYNMFATVIK